MYKCDYFVKGYNLRSGITQTLHVCSLNPHLPVSPPTTPSTTHPGSQNTAFSSMVPLPVFTPEILNCPSNGCVPLTLFAKTNFQFLEEIGKPPLPFLTSYPNGWAMGQGTSLPRSLSVGWLFQALGIISLRAFRTNWLLINLQMLNMSKVTWGWMMEKYSSNRIFWVRSPGTYFWIFTPACLILSYPQGTGVRPGPREQPAHQLSLGNTILALLGDSLRGEREGPAME